MKAFRFFLLSLIALLVAVPYVPAGARLRGDWETAGALAPPYDAPYRYEYACQIEVSDGVVSKGARNSFRIFAVANVKVESKPVIIEDFSTLKWTYIAKSNDEVEYEIVKPENGPSLAGHYFSFYLNHTEGQEDRAILNVRAAMPLGDYRIPQMSFANVPRSQMEVSARAKVAAYRVTLSPLLPEEVKLKVFVVCDKLK